MERTKLWFSDFDKKYEGSEPFFYATNEIAIARELEDNYSSLIGELKVLWDNENKTTASTFGSYDNFDDKQFPPRSWQKMVFKVWGVKNKNICKRFPFVSSLVERFPNTTSCFLTKTSPHSVIRLHCGETNAHLRIHLGLQVPLVDKDICGMEVGNQTIGWQNGKTFAFLDAHSHHVWNNSDSERYVLIVDVLRPEFQHLRYFICARVIVSQLFFWGAIMLKLPNPDKVRSTFLDTITYLLYLPIVSTIKLNNRWGFLKL